MPTCDCFIDGFAARDIICANRQHIDHFAIQLVACANVKSINAIQHVQFGNTQACQAVNTCRAAQCGGIKPAAATFAFGDCANFFAFCGHLVASATFSFNIQLAWEWATADACGVSFGDAKHIVQHIRAHARAAAGLAGDAIARSDIWICAVVDV